MKEQVESKLLDKAKLWLNAPFDNATRAAVQHLIDEEPGELIESFYTDLEFGTGGMRGLMGVGTNRVNTYTLGRATQGLANYTRKAFPNDPLKAAIAHDSRNNSRLFAEKTAEIFAANGFDVYLFEDLRPTPELSYAIRSLKCHTGVVITASHNPKEYNGYKVYWGDGAQIVAPQDKEIIQSVNEVGFGDILTEFNPDSIHQLGHSLDRMYLDQVKDLCLSPKLFKAGNDLKIVYTSLHGTGITLIPHALANHGFTDVNIVPEQDVPDGNFPTVDSPNPEERAALDQAIELGQKVHADIILGTDPDTDRVGLAVPDENGEFVLLNGNQSGVLLVWYTLYRLMDQGKLKGQPYVARTIVTTHLIDLIAESFGVAIFETLTGFKWIANIIRKFQGSRQYVVGGEESYGYLIRDFVRDKDAVSATVMFCELAAWAKDKGKSVYELLDEIHQEYGCFAEDLMSFKREGKKGKEEIAQMMTDMRTHAPETIGGSPVIEVLDYQSAEAHMLLTGAKRKLDFPQSNVIQFVTEDGTIVTARPSGTEPKIKFYFSVRAPYNKQEERGGMQSLKEKIEGIKKDLNLV